MIFGPSFGSVTRRGPVRSVRHRPGPAGSARGQQPTGRHRTQLDPVRVGGGSSPMISRRTASASDGAGLQRRQHVEVVGPHAQIPNRPAMPPVCAPAGTRGRSGSSSMRALRGGGSAARRSAELSTSSAVICRSVLSANRDRAPGDGCCSDRRLAPRTWRTAASRGRYSATSSSSSALSFARRSSSFRPRWPRRPQLLGELDEEVATLGVEAFLLGSEHRDGASRVEASVGGSGCGGCGSPASAAR